MLTGSQTSAAGATVNGADLAARSLRELGILVPEAYRPAQTGAVSQGDLAARVLRAVGINPVAETDMLAAFGVVDPALIAARALQSLGLNPVVTVTDTADTLTDPSTVVSLVLQRLQVIDPTETASTDDVAICESFLTNLILSLVRNGIVAFVPTSIPLRAVDSLVLMLSYMVGPAFNKAVDASDYASGERSLRLQQLSGFSGQEIALQTVNAVHDGLLARNVVAWPNYEIPNGAAEAYIALTASALLSSFLGIHDAATPSDSSIRSDAISKTLGQDTAAEQMLRTISLSGNYGQALAAAAVAAVQDDLGVRGLISWPITAIPVAHGEDYVVMATCLLAPQIQPDRSADLRQTDQTAYDAAVERVKDAAKVNNAQDLVTARMQSVHEELVGDNMASWTFAAIPAAYADAYVDLATQSAAPSFGGKFDPDAYAMAQKRLRRTVMGSTNGQAIAVQTVLETHQEMVADGLASWTADTVPLQAGQPYVDAAAQRLAPYFDEKMDPGALADAMRRVKIVAMAGQAGQALAEQKIMAVHSQLDVMGMTRWSIYDLPDYAEEPYVLMAASLLAPEWDVKSDPTWWQAGMSMIGRATVLKTSNETAHVVYF